MTSVNSISPAAKFELYKLQHNIPAGVRTIGEDGTLYNGNGYAVSQSGETCTDGKDDGKIGFWNAALNTAKGAGKTAVNMVKGCFTGKDGKFSLGKTLLSLGTAALCVAFPAVGLVACGIGAVAGGAQVAKGVYNAATAGTDAEAKEAWQNVGGGALTTGLSVAGGKASYGAVMKTSTAGINGGNAMSELGKDSSLLSKGGALLKDIASSTSNRTAAIKAAAKHTYNIYNVYTTCKKESDIVQAKQVLKEAKKSGNADDIASANQHLNEVKAGYKTARQELKALYKEEGEKVFNNIKSNLNKQGLAKAAGKLKGLPKQIASEISSGKASLDTLVSKYGYDNVIQVLEVLGSTEAI